MAHYNNFMTMRNALLKTLLLLNLTLLASCSHDISVIFPERSSAEYEEDIANGSPDFAEGWKAGCEVGESAGSNTFYKMFYRNNNIDGYKASYSPDYRTAWNNAFWWCYRRNHVKQKSSIWGSTFKGHI